MQIVIDIDDMAYKFVQNITFVEDVSTLLNQTKVDREKTLYLFDILGAIKNGIPLPKGHGRLIDKDKMIADLLTVDPQYKNLVDWCLRAATAQPTIIEADKVGEEGK